MSFPNQQSPPQMSLEQLAGVLSILGRQPQANPTSPLFDPNYFSQIMSIQNKLFSQTIPTQFVQSNPEPSKPTCSYQVVKMVDDPDNIQPQEVAMGFSNLFPSLDGHKIFVKSWDTEGSIKTRIYEEIKDKSDASKKVVDGNSPKNQNDDQFEAFSNKIMARMERFEEAITKLQQSQEKIIAESKAYQKGAHSEQIVCHKSGGLMAEASQVPRADVIDVDEEEISYE